MYGGSADGVIAQMRHLSGDVPMFPLWTYGFWQCKERYKSAAEVLSVVDRYRELQVPLDGIIQDWQYWGSNYLWNAMDFLTEEYANGEQMISDIHKKNAHFMISIWAASVQRPRHTANWMRRDCCLILRHGPRADSQDGRHVWTIRLVCASMMPSHRKHGIYIGRI